MRRRLLAAMGGALALIAGSAQAQDPPRQFVRIRWTVAEVPADNGPFTLKKGQGHPFAKVVPADMIRLDAEIRNQGGKLVLPAGAILAWSTIGSRIACQPAVTTYKVFVCLEDGDGDGQFERYAMIMGTLIQGPSISSFMYLIGTYEFVTRKWLVSPIPVPAAAPAGIFDPVALEVRFAYQSRKAQQASFALCGTGAGTRKRYCMPAWVFTDRDYPATRRISNGSVTVVGIQKTVATLTISPPAVGKSLY